ncbi:MAG: DEAD/DEAH box helicase [Cyclobacteriaceae bacterium]
MNDFSKLGLSSTTIDVLDQLGFEKPTPVQSEAIPLLLGNDPCDFIGLAQTGTGKTAAFGLPLMDLINSDDSSTQALIMAPTRELGQQTAKQLVDFSKNHKSLNVEVVYGGAAIVNQIKALRKPTQIVVATPGRLMDLIKRKAVKLENVKYVVLDEADEMLNMGFKEAIDEILSHIPGDHATWLFSATMPAEIRRIVKKYMTDPKEVTINREEKSNKDISHKYVMTKTGNKLAALRRFLDLQPDMRGVMFCRTRRETQQIADELSQQGYNSEALHGELSQQQRDAVMKRFKAKNIQLLIATDVAARGIDVNDLTHVLHHTLPDQLESYTHRSGRTGRAGKKGVSLVFINPREGRKITELERRIKVKFEHIEVPGVESIKAQRIKNWVDGILETKADSKAEEIYKSIEEEFEHLSKSDVLKKLIASQIDSLVKGGEETNLNEKVGGSPEKRDRGRFNRYFINVGSMDGMTKGEVLYYISEISKVEAKFFGDINLQKNCSYFEVDKRYDDDIASRFQNVHLDGRSIRMNREDGSDRGPKMKKKYRPDRKFSKKDYGRPKRRKR